MKPTTTPKKRTRKLYNGTIRVIEYYDPLLVLCPDKQKRKCYIRDNIYGEETYLGTLKIWHTDGNYGWREVEIPGWVKPNKNRKKTYDFIPYQDSPFAYILYPAKERLV